MIRKLLYISLLFTFCSIKGIGQNKIDSILTLLKLDKEDTNKVLHLTHLSFQYDLQSNVKKALSYGDSAITLAKKLNFIRGYANASTDVGTYYMETEQYANAWNSFSIAVKLYSQLNDKKGLAGVKNHIGEFYDAQGNYPKALECYLDALTMVKEIGDQKEISSFMDNIGVIYWKQGEDDKALDFELKALNLCENANDKFNIAITLGNIGIVYDDKKEYDKALEYYTKAIKIQKETNDSNGTARNTVNIGIINFNLGNYSKALDCYRDALKIFKNLGDKQRIEETYSNMGVVYLKEKKYKDAENYFLMSYDSTEGIKDLEEIRDVNKNLSDLYSETGQTQKALESYKLYVAAKDSLVNETRSKEIGHIEAKAEYEKQLAIQQAEEDTKTALSEAETKRQKLFSLLIGAIALVAILLAFTIFRSLKTTRKQKLIAEKQKVLQELKTLRAQMNPHFIFNAINSIKNVVLENDSAAASKHLSTFSKLMREVLENSKHESIPLAKELQMLTLYVDLELLRFSSKFTYSISVDSSINPENVLISPLIIQPYVENAIWHGLMHLQNRKGELVIRIADMHNGMMKCTIDDNGIGREKSAEAKKGKMYQSLGISITQERLEIINSLYKSNISMQIIDKKNSDVSSAGTCVELILPLITNRVEHA